MSPVVKSHVIDQNSLTLTLLLHYPGNIVIDDEQIVSQ